MYGIEVRSQLWRYYAVVAFCLFLYGPSPPALADKKAANAGDAAEQWLKRMFEASRSLSYEGRFVYLQGQGRQIEVMQIAHSGRSGRQRMVSLSGPLREVVVDAQTVVSLMSEHEVTLHTDAQNRSLFPISFPHDLSALRSLYRFELLGHDRVAEHVTREVAVRPQDGYRYGYRLWLHEPTGMVLRSALVNEHGDFLEQMMFTDIVFKDSVDASRLRSTLKPATLLQMQATSPSPPLASGWTVDPLPNGFQQTLRQVYPASPRRPVTEHRVYSDGLATVSAFFEPLAAGAPALLDGAATMGAVSAYGRVLDGYQVLVVGEVPAGTVAAIAAAIQEGTGPAGKQPQ